jgi:hypothetical protein
LIEVVGDAAIAISPFGGDWVELVDAFGEKIGSLVPPPPGDRDSPGQLTALPDGRLIATGRFAGGSGVYFLILEVMN